MKSLTVSDAREIVLNGGPGFTEDDYGCWLWDDTLHNGYGPWPAFYEQAFGPVPKGWEVVWSCRNGLNGCVNPAHMKALEPLDAARERKKLPDRDRRTWAEAIRAEREGRGWSKRRMARELGVAPVTITKWENGQVAREPLRRIVAFKLGWEGQPRKFTVVTIIENVVVAQSGAEAVHQVNRLLDEKEITKRDHYSVRVLK